MINGLIRELQSKEIEVRVGQVNDYGLNLLLYVTAPTCESILDEAVGVLGWQKSYSRENANCTVSIWDDTKKMWISREDTGTESFAEKEKGLASDSFKRACRNFGIGRSLAQIDNSMFVKKEKLKSYTAPSQDASGGKRGGKCYDSFVVDAVAYENGKIVGLAVRDESKVDKTSVKSSADYALYFDNRKDPNTPWK